MSEVSKFLRSMFDQGSLTSGRLLLRIARLKDFLERYMTETSLLIFVTDNAVPNLLVST